jgi:DNA-binding MarR family transcriptional regulator
MGMESSLVDSQEINGCVCFALRRAARALTQFYDRALRPHGLRATQLPILWAANAKGSVPLAALAQELGLDRTTLLRNVRPLVRRRLVSVAPTANSRRTEIRGTAGGRALLARLYPHWKRAQEQALQTLEGTDWSRGLDALTRMARKATE